MSVRRGEDGEDYVRQYPRLAHWIVTCIACGRRGHKPEMPANDDPDFSGQNLRQFFKPLAVDSDGLCEQCAHARRQAEEAIVSDSQAEQT